MSKFNLIALAVAASLAAPSAFAAEATVTAAVVNSNQFTTSAVTATIPVVTVKATAADNYLGRTVGYNVRVKVSAGKISTAPTIAVTGGAVSATLVTGTGAVGSTEFVVNVVPAAGGTQVGEGFTITGLAVDNVGSLNAGGSISVSGAVFDPTTAIELPGSAFTKVAYTAKEGVSVTVTQEATPAKIDVGVPSNKKFFVATPYTVGNGTNANLFTAGEIKIADAVGVTPWLPGTGTADITITGDDFSAFKTSTATGNTPAKIGLATDATCGTAIGTAATISADGKSATFTGVVLNTLNAGTTAFVCLDANSVTSIVRQDLSASVVVKPGSAFSSFSIANQGLASMVYNGSVAYADHFNPASNMNQRSYLRIINPGTVAGLVSVEGVCDDGTVQPAVSIGTLGAGQAKLVNASDLAGLGFTQCTSGKSRLTVTGEFGGMRVQNFLRNATTAGDVNTNVNLQN